MGCIRRKRKVGVRDGLWEDPCWRKKRMYVQLLTIPLAIVLLDERSKAG